MVVGAGWRRVAIAGARGDAGKECGQDRRTSEKPAHDLDPFIVNGRSAWSYAHERRVHMTVPAPAELGADDFVAPGACGAVKSSVTASPPRGTCISSFNSRIAKPCTRSAERITSRTGSPAVT